MEMTLGRHRKVIVSAPARGRARGGGTMISRFCGGAAEALIYVFRMRRRERRLAKTIAVCL